MYKTLDVLPIKVCFDIIATDDVFLLRENENETYPIGMYKQQWEILSKQFEVLNPNKTENKTFKLQKEIDMHLAKQKTILVACAALDFDWNDELVTLLRSWNYSIKRETYYDDLDRIKRESKGLVLKADNVQKMLNRLNPDPNENQSTIDDVLAGYSAFLGIDIGDYNKVSVTKYFAFGRQVDNKIKALEKQIADSQNSNKK